MTNQAFIVICCLLAPCCLARVFDGAVQPLSSCGNGHGTVEVTLLGEEGCSNAVLLAMENRTPYPYGFGQQSLSSGFDCLELDFITSSGRMFTLKRRMPPGLCDLSEWNEVEPGYQWTMPVKLDDEAWIIPEGAVEHSPAFVRPRFAFGGFRVGDKFYRLKEDADRKVMRHYGWSDRQGELVGEWIPLSRLNLRWTTITRREATSPDSCGEDGVWTDPSGNTWRYHAVSGGVEIGRVHIGAKDEALYGFLAMSGSKDDLYKGAFSVGVTPNPTNDVLCLPDKILGRVVVSVGDYAFLGLAGPKRVTVPSAIRRIGTGAFARSEVAVIKFAFCECGLEQVSFPATLRRLDPGCFRGNSNLTTVTFRAEVSITFGGEVVWTSCRDGDDGNTCRVDSRAFEDCPQLDSVVIAGRTYSWRKIEASVKDAANARNRKIE